jgi:uncharacterized membrane protein HdeD (DUF308 family)
MNTRATYMINPFDGALYATSTACGFVFGLATGNSPLTAAIASATIVGVFSLVAALIRIYVEGKRDRRIAELEKRLQAAGLTEK